MASFEDDSKFLILERLRLERDKAALEVEAAKLNLETNRIVRDHVKKVSEDAAKAVELKPFKLS